MIQFAQKKIKVSRNLNDGSRLCIGMVSLFNKGWKFNPYIFGRNRSTKFHETWEKAIPKWVGYPNSCETEVVYDHSEG